jgi:hypothetical protein
MQRIENRLPGGVEDIRETIEAMFALAPLRILYRHGYPEVTIFDGWIALDATMPRVGDAPIERDRLILAPAARKHEEGQS